MIISSCGRCGESVDNSGRTAGWRGVDGTTFCADRASFHVVDLDHARSHMGEEG